MRSHPQKSCPICGRQPRKPIKDRALAPSDILPHLRIRPTGPQLSQRIQVSYASTQRPRSSSQAHQSLDPPATDSQSLTGRAQHLYARNVRKESNSSGRDQHGWTSVHERL